MEHWCKTIQRLLSPHETNFKKQRIGDCGDGGYVICPELVPDALYSYGSNDNISFEKDFFKIFNKNSYVYDHTIDKITDKPEYVLFFKEGIGKHKTSELNTLENHLKDNNHLDNKNLFLQMDVEGCEWDVLENQPIENFSQIVLELHIYPSMFHKDPFFAQKVIDTLTYINKFFLPVHIHGNNACSPNGNPWLVEGELPMCSEVTYIRKDLVTSHKLDTQTYPINGLDKDNNPNLPSMKLKWSKV